MVPGILSYSRELSLFTYTMVSQQGDMDMTFKLINMLLYLMNQTFYASLTHMRILNGAFWNSKFVVTKM